MSSRLPHIGYILNPDLLQRSSFRGHCNTDRLGLGMSKAEIKAKHPEGTSPKHIDAMHKYMTQEGMSFQQAHNKAEASGFPALGMTNNQVNRATKFVAGGLLVAFLYHDIFISKNPILGFLLP